MFNASLGAGVAFRDHGLNLAFCMFSMLASGLAWLFEVMVRGGHQGTKRDYGLQMCDHCQYTYLCAPFVSVNSGTKELCGIHNLGSILGQERQDGILRQALYYYSLYYIAQLGVHLGSRPAGWDFEASTLLLKFVLYCTTWGPSWVKTGRMGF